MRAVARDPDHAALPGGVERVAMFGDPDFARGALDTWAGFMTEPEVVTTGDAEVTGEPARPFRDWAAEHADDFR